MSSLLTKPIVQHHRSRVSPIQLRDFPLGVIISYYKYVKFILVFASGTICTGISHHMPSALTAVDVGKICARHLVYEGLAAEQAATVIQLS